MAVTCYCEKCGRTMNEREFYTSRNKEKYPPDGKLRQCKKCLTMHVDNWDPETYKWILEEIDVPYVKEWWDELLADWLKKNDVSKITGLSILGKYLAKMRIKQYSGYSYADSEQIAEKLMAEKVVTMRAKGFSGEEIEEQLKMDRTPAKPIVEAAAAGITPLDTQIEPAVEQDAFDDQLTDEDKMYLRLKWGASYRPSEWVIMEQLYNDMMASYDIQSAGHKDTLIMICKASLKANQCIDAGDIEGFQKISKVYDSLMKSGKFQAIQNKEENGEAVDSVGELVAMCERDKFIPRFYVDSPKDKIDRIIQDMQQYTTDLVTQELGLENLIQNSLRDLENERASIRAASEAGEDLEKQYEDELFNYDKNILEDQDFQDFAEFEQEDEGEE